MPIRDNQTLPLFPDEAALRDSVAAVYAQAGDAPVSNDALYEGVARHARCAPEALSLRTPVGNKKTPRSTAKRSIRWAQQSLKMRGWIERVESERGQWRVTREGRYHLRRLHRGQSLIAFSTALGVAVWGDCADALDHLEGEIDLVLTSPPYPIRNPRAYGGIDEQGFVDFLCRVIEPFVERLARGGSLAINIGNDVFLSRSPARSLYQERLVLALADRFSLHKMDALIWHSNKMPGPIQWASLNRMQLNTAFEPIYWFTNDPLAVHADNRRVLEPHSEAHARMLSRQDLGPARASGDGAHRVRPGRSYANQTEGRIPRNVLSHSNTCAHHRALNRAAREAGLPTHGAVMPLSLARFLVRWLSAPGDLVADPMGGRMTTAAAAELEGRRWWSAERYAEYLAQSAAAFIDAPGFRAAA